MIHTYMNVCKEPERQAKEVAPVSISAVKHLLGFSIVLFVLAGCGQETSEPQVPATELVRPAKIVPVTVQTPKLIRTYPGILESSEQVDLAFRVGGQIIRLPARAGKQVFKGELLAALDDTDYRNAVEDRRARFELAKTRFEQISQLLQKKLTSQIQFDQARSELRSAEAALRQAEDNLKYTRLTAPFDGIVARVDVENFQTIQPHVPIMRLQDGSRLDVRFHVPESTILQLSPKENPEAVRNLCGQVTFADQPARSYRACYKERESQPDPVTRNYAVVFALDPVTDIVALPGMSVTISLDLTDFLPRSHQPQILVPVEAVFDKDGAQWVWRVDEHQQARLTHVTPGRMSGDQMTILEGLNPGDRVIAAGVSHVREGMKVRPMIKERGL
ncbi:MAG: efflux RND transporter periplasmic adaptor subunit [Gammaproteobacteria bacterium]|nr:MAG: efflux RND transporter periplasmic adaptor subunit [Gammaproteobacteria bacterium]